MSVDDRFRERWSILRETNEELRRLAGGGGGGHPPSMEAEIAVLKQRADQADHRLERVEQKLDRIGETLGGLATKATVWTALATGGGIAFAVLGIFVAVPAYLQDQRIAARPEAPPAPIILQLPVPPAAIPVPAQPAAPAPVPAR